MNQRILGITGALAGILLIIAIAVIWSEARSVRPEAEGPLFPGIEQSLHQVTKITITTSKGSFSLEDKNGHWVMPEKSDYPVNLDKARELVSSFASATRAEAKTDKPALYPQIGVGEPAKDPQARKVELFDADGNSIADLIVGKAQKIQGGAQAPRVFARIDGQARSWLVAGLAEVSPRPVDWLKPDFIDLAPARVMSVSIDHPESDKKGEDVTVYKDSPSDTHFKVKDLPKTHEMRSPGAADGLGNALASVSFEDVVNASERPKDLPVTTVTYRTFDGLVLTLSITGTDGNHWATVKASVDEDLRKAFAQGKGAATIPASEDPDKEAADLNARLSGWSYHLPRFKALDLLKYKHSFITPKTQKESP